MTPDEKPEPSTGSGTVEHEMTTPLMTHDFGFVPIPRRLRYDPQKPFHSDCTFIVANLYYCQVRVGINLQLYSSNDAAGFQPLLTLAVQFSESFGVDYNRVSRYATGILFISPLGDLVRRRQLILLLAIISGSLTIGLAITPNLVVFEVLSYVIGFVSVTPQIMIPLAADLAPPERRAAALSVVMSGLLFGILVARVIAGILAEFTSWRVVYYFAIGVQYLVLVAGYFVIPDYPAKNKHMSYWGILRTMAKFAYTEPILVQACLVNLASCACFTNFWVTLTFLLGGAPYYYSTLAIGLFGLIGIFGVACGPLVGRLVDKLIPWYASLVAVIAATCFQAIQVGAGDVSVGAIIVVIMGLDVFRQMLQMSLATSLFIGQLMGTAAGTEVFTKYGWRPAAALNVGFYGWIFIIIMLRGPHCARYTWFGFEGGWEARKNVVDAKKKQAGESVAEGKDLESGGTTTPQGELPTTEKMPVASPGSDEKVSTEEGSRRMRNRQ
ncbi:major facilitator superfamily domain-containing protein [Mycena olivaceomarginata]|nr:major facilitator superfamily domain-containing protein [Mycena olivaceomarginata]